MVGLLVWCASAGGKVSDAAAKREAQLTATVAALQRTLDRARKEAETGVGSAKYAQVTASAVNPACCPDCIKHCNAHSTFLKSSAARVVVWYLKSAARML